MTLPKIFLSVFFVAAVMAAPSLLIAQEKEKSPLDREALFKAMDRDKDGSVSKEEFFKLWKKNVENEKVFQEMDKNKDGKLSFEEFHHDGLVLFRW